MTHTHTQTHTKSEREIHTHTERKASSCAKRLDDDVCPLRTRISK
jgi:hypothetical protein